MSQKLLNNRYLIIDQINASLMLVKDTNNENEL